MRQLYAALTIVCFCGAGLACLAQTGERLDQNQGIERPDTRVSERKADSLTAVSQSNCPPCARLEPILKRLAQEGYQVEIVPVAKSPSPVRVTPTLFFQREGTTVEKHEGFMTYEQIVKRLDKPLLGFEVDTDIIAIKVDLRKLPQKIWSFVRRK